MATGSHCERCATLLSAAAGGLCPACLVQGALAVSFPTDEPNRASCFGDYELIAELGRGGMGVVYSARQISLDRIVALKRMQNPALADESQKQRFEKEAGLIARFSHPNIVAVFDRGEHEGELYFAMEYIEGRDLSQIVAGKPLPSRKAANYVRAIAEALSHAHEKGVLHRDLKPSNVIIDEQDRPHITDFGLGKLIGPGAPKDISAQFVGTLAYSSPEQMEGKPVANKPTADVYSLGALLYELLTGRPPFVANSTAEIIRLASAVEPIQPHRLNASVPSDLETICLKCLAKDPGARYPTAQALAEDMARFLAGETIHARPATRVEKTWKWCRRKPATASMLALLLGVTLAGILSVLAQWRRAESAAKGEAEQRRRAVETLAQMAVVSADGALKTGDGSTAIAYLAQALRQDPSNRLVVDHLISVLAYRDFATPALSPLSHGAACNFAQFSPDGRRLITASSDHTARIWDAATGEPVGKPLVHTGAVNSAKFSADGKFVLTASQDGTARVWDPDRGGQILGPLEHHSEVLTADFSRDGRVIATVQQRAVVIWNATNGQRVKEPISHRLAKAIGPGLRFVQFSPDGQTFLSVATNRVRIVPVWETNASERLGGGPDDPLFESATFNPAGTDVVTASSDDIARVWDRQSGTLRMQLIGHRGDVLFAQFSPDGTRIVTTSTDGTARLWDARTGRPWCEPLPHSAWVTYAQFSADGLKLLTVADDRTVRIWHGMTNELLCETIELADKIVSAQFSPNGERLLVASGRQALVWDIRPGRARPELHRGFSGVANWEGKFDANRRTLAASDASLWRAHSLGPRESIAKALGEDVKSAQAHWSMGGAWLIGHSTNGCQIHAYPTGAPITARLAQQGPVAHVAFSRDTNWCVTVDTNRITRVWETKTGRMLTNVFIHDSVFMDPLFSPDGRRILLAGTNGSLNIFHIESGNPVGKPMIGGASFTCADFSPDGRVLVTATFGRSSHLRDAATGEPIGSPLRHDHPVMCARFSADGTAVLTASLDRTARLWNPENGAPLTEPLRHSSPVLCAAFSPDGRRVATITEEREAQVWDARSAAPLGQPLRLGRTPALVEFSGDGEQLIVRLRPRTSRQLNSGSQALITQTWRVPSLPLPAPDWLADFAEASAGRRVASDGQAARLNAVDYFKARTDLAKRGENDPYVAFARWFIDDREARKIAPGSVMRVREYVFLLLKETIADALQESALEGALMLSADGRTHARLARALASRSKTEESGLPTRGVMQAIQLAEYATVVSPDFTETWTTRISVLERASRDPEIASVLDAALHHRPGDPVLWEAKAARQERAEQWEDALATYSGGLAALAKAGNTNGELRGRFEARQSALSQKLRRGASGVPR